MSLRGAPLLYIFYETASLPRQRELCEDVFGLPVIENQFHPPHEYHGLVKYDAGGTILSLNLAREARFEKEASDGFVTVLSVDSEEALRDRLRAHGYTPPKEAGSLFTDAYGHHYTFRGRSGAPANGRGPSPVPAVPPLPSGPTVQELRLTVSDLAASVTFYRDTLGLELLEQHDETARFATGTVDLVIERGQLAPDGRPPRYTTYLIVFYTYQIERMWETLQRRGLVFKSHRVGFSDIGSTVRFFDPSGHTFCLYEPSEESLGWGSGPKVRELMSATVAVD